MADLNGVYTSSLDFSNFVVGSYNPVLGNPQSSGFLSDVGTITLNVISVPEPSSLTALGVGIATLVGMRRRKGIGT